MGKPVRRCGEQVPDVVNEMGRVSRLLNHPPDHKSKCGPCSDLFQIHAASLDAPGSFDSTVTPMLARTDFAANTYQCNAAMFGLSMPRCRP